MKHDQQIEDCLLSLGYIFINHKKAFDLLKPTGADPGFPVGGVADPLGGCQHTILSNFLKNCMKSRNFWAVGGLHARGAPLNPPLTKFIF